LEEGTLHDCERARARNDEFFSEQRKKKLKVTLTRRFLSLLLLSSLLLPPPLLLLHPLSSFNGFSRYNFRIFSPPLLL
jgi:hypothetical protein